MADDLVKLIALLRKLDAAATPGPWEADGRHVVTSNELGWITGHVADAGEQDVDLIVVVRNHLTRLLDAAGAGMSKPIGWAVIDAVINHPDPVLFHDQRDAIGFADKYGGRIVRLVEDRHGR